MRCCAIAGRTRCWICGADTSGAGDGRGCPRRRWKRIGVFPLFRHAEQRSGGPRLRCSAMRNNDVGPAPGREHLMWKRSSGRRRRFLRTLCDTRLLFIVQKRRREEEDMIHRARTTRGHDSSCKNFFHPYGDARRKMSKTEMEMNGANEKETLFGTSTTRGERGKNDHDRETNSYFHFRRSF